jgi:hypothetical protein
MLGQVEGLVVQFCQPYESFCPVYFLPSPYSKKKFLLAPHTYALPLLPNKPHLSQRLLRRKQRQ